MLWPAKTVGLSFFMKEELSVSEQNPVNLAVEDAVAIVTIDHPPVNAMGNDVCSGLLKAANEIKSRQDIQGVILHGANEVFVAGADINVLLELRDPVVAEEVALTMQTLHDVIEDLAVPVVVAIQRFAFGGGLELAMSGHYRIATKDSKLGLPEVTLGVLPGAGGTQRLARLVGLEQALKMITSGRDIPAKAALSIGLVDKLVEGPRIMDEARAFLKDIIEKKAPLPMARKLENKIEDKDHVRAACAFAREETLKQTKGHYPAPMAAIDAIEVGALTGYEKGIVAERKAFAKVAVGDIAKNLMHVFFGMRTVSKVPGMDRSIKPKKINKAAVIGAGFMGSGIAHALVLAGIPTIIKDVDEAIIQKSVSGIRYRLDDFVKKGRMSAEACEEKMNLIQTTTSYDGFEDVDIVIEAATENIDLKKKIFTTLTELCSPQTILATNTSTIPIGLIAAETTRPEKVIGLHFFSPVHRMKLLEVIKTDKTDDATVCTSLGLAKRIRKTAVVVNDAPGFVVNFALFYYLRVAAELVVHGAGVDEVDKAVRDFGMPMGPLTMVDMAGLDVVAKAGLAINDVSGNKYPPAKLLVALNEAGRFGQKNGKGHYLYKEGQRKGVLDPAVDEIIEKLRKEQNIEPRVFTQDEIQETVMLALANGAIQTLDAGTAMRPVDIDMAMIMGIGFPSFRGGPMKYADSIGAAALLEKLEKLEPVYGHVFTPAQCLKDLAEKGGAFYV